MSKNTDVCPVCHSDLDITFTTTGTKTCSNCGYMKLAKRKQVPKYVKELVRKRTKAAQKLRETGIAVDEYCSSIGLDEFHPLFDDACLYTDIRIWCEEDHSEPNTLKAIEKVLNGETE